jgi:type II secretory pathway pseudopilin PulG
MTLVELMVSIAITGVVMAAAVGIFTAQHRNYVRDRSEKEVAQDAGDVLRLLQRDLMEAGWSVNPAMAFYIQDGGANGSDRLYVNDVDLIDPVAGAARLMDSQCAACLSIASGSGTTTLTVADPLNDASCTDDLDIDGDGVDTDSCGGDGLPDADSDGDGADVVGGVYQFVISDSGTNKVARVTSTSGLQVTTADPLSGTFLAPALYYCVDDGNADCHPAGSPEVFVLRRSDRSTGGRQVVAANVADLQVAYQDDAGNWYGAAGCAGVGVGGGFCEMSPFDPSRIQVLRVSVVLRSPTRDRDRLNDPSFCRPAVENRTAGGAAADCGYLYRTYTVLIHPRNT